MAETFHLVIASVGETTFDGAALSATLPGSSGEMTVLAHHEPIVSILKKGSVSIRVGDGEDQKFDIEGGMVEVSNNRVVVLL